MGIRFLCPACTKRINVKEHQAGKRGFCPKCGAPVLIPLVSQLPERDDDSRSTLKQANAPAISQQAATQQVAGGQAAGVPVGRIIASAGPSAADPLAEFPGATWYVASAGAAQPFGPADAAIMIQWLQEGRIVGDSLVWRQDWPEWLPAAAVWPQLGMSAGIAATMPMHGGTMPAAPPLVPDVVGGATGPVPPQRSTPGAVGSAAHSPAIYYHHRRPGGWYAVTVVVLLLLVAVLACVMYFVLTRDPGPIDDETSRRMPRPATLRTT